MYVYIIKINEHIFHAITKKLIYHRIKGHINFSFIDLSLFTVNTKLTQILVEL